MHNKSRGQWGHILERVKRQSSKHRTHAQSIHSLQKISNIRNNFLAVIVQHLPKTSFKAQCYYCGAQLVITEEPPSCWRRTILIFSPTYQRADTLGYWECGRTNQFSILHRQTSQERSDWLLLPGTSTRKHLRNAGAHPSSRGPLLFLKVKSRLEAVHWRRDGADMA